MKTRYKLIEGRLVPVEYDRGTRMHVKPNQFTRDEHTQFLRMWTAGLRNAQMRLSPEYTQYRDSLIAGLEGGRSLVICEEPVAYVDPEAARILDEAHEAMMGGGGDGGRGANEATGNTPRLTDTDLARIRSEHGAQFVMFSQVQSPTHFDPQKEPIGTPQQVMAMEEREPQQADYLQIEGLGTIRIEAFTRNYELGSSSRISDKSDPPFLHMVGWDLHKAQKWITYRGWKIVR